MRAISSTVASGFCNEMVNLFCKLCLVSLKASLSFPDHHCWETANRVARCNRYELACILSGILAKVLMAGSYKLICFRNKATSIVPFHQKAAREIVGE